MIGNRVLGVVATVLLASTFGVLAACGHTDESAGSGIATVQAANVSISALDASGNEVNAGAGILIAPRAVLTVGHLVAGNHSWTITSADGKSKVTGTKGMTYDWMNYDESAKSHPRKHDIAVIYLDRPIDLAHYPALASARKADGSAVTRVKLADGTFATVASTLGRVRNFPNAYVTDISPTETLDTGGAVFDDHGDILGLVMGRGMDTGKLYLARTDALSTWLLPKVTCGGGTRSGGATDGTTDDGKSGGSGGGIVVKDVSSGINVTCDAAVTAPKPKPVCAKSLDGGAKCDGGASDDGGTSTDDNPCDDGGGNCSGSDCGPNDKPSPTPTGGSPSGGDSSGGSPSGGDSSGGSPSGGPSTGGSSSGGPNGGGSSDTPPDVCTGPQDNPEVCPPEPDGCTGGDCGGASAPGDGTMDYGYSRPSAPASGGSLIVR